MAKRRKDEFDPEQAASMAAAEIAEYLGLSPNTIRVQLKIALEKLKKEVSPLMFFLIFSTF